MYIYIHRFIIYQCKSNVNLYSQGVRRLTLEKMISLFLILDTVVHISSIDDVYFQTIEHCDQNDKGKREPFWIETLQSIYLYGLSLNSNRLTNFMY